MNKQEIPKNEKTNWNVSPFPTTVRNAFGAVCKLRGINVADQLAQVVTDWMIKEGYEEFIK